MGVVAMEEKKEGKTESITQKADLVDWLLAIDAF